jgi:hypothetical protein
MTQPDIDNRFTLLCKEVAAAVNGERGHIEFRHIIELRDHLLTDIYEIRQQARRGHTLHSGQVDRLWDVFTDITGISEPGTT